MATFKFKVLTFTFNERTDRVSNIEFTTVRVVADSKNAAISYSPNYSSSLAGFPDVYIDASEIQQIVLANGIELHGDSAYLGRANAGGKSSIFMMLGDYIGGHKFRAAVVVLSGDELPNIKTEKQFYSWWEDLNISRITSGTFAPGKDISLNAIQQVGTSGGSTTAPKSVIEGNSKDNTLVGTKDDDTIKGKAGNDTLKGEGGDDALYGGNGKDLLIGGNGNDRLFGEAGNDKLEGGFGVDQLKGGAGRDVLAGGRGNDILTGGAGVDTFVFSKSSNGGGNIGRDVITDYRAGEVIDLSGYGKLDLKITQNGGSTVLVYGDVGRVVLENFSKGQLDMDAILF